MPKFIPKKIVNGEKEKKNFLSNVLNYLNALVNMSSAVVTASCRYTL